MSAYLAVAVITVLAAATARKPAYQRRESGSRAHGDPTDSELKKRARGLLESGVCGDGALYHVTSSAALPAIAASGLRPRSKWQKGEFVGTFDGFDDWSRDKVFLAGGEEALSYWLHLVSSGRRSRLRFESVKILRVRPGMEQRVRPILHDWKGHEECSFFTTRDIPAEILELRSDSGSWVPVRSLKFDSRES